MPAVKELLKRNSNKKIIKSPRRKNCLQGIFILHTPGLLGNLLVVQRCYLAAG
jgi:hypothetical protein